MENKSKKTSVSLSSVVDNNIATWKKLPDCKTRFEKSTIATSWVKSTGNFSENPASPKNFKKALSIDATNNLEAAFDASILIGMVCQESSFGTNFNNAGSYKGAFQIAQIVVTEYNNNNPSNKVTFPGDVDDLADLEKASKVAAWYFAMNLQRLTKTSQDISPVKVIKEARKFAIASYNGGPTLIKKARELTNQAKAGEGELWSKVKANLETAGATTAKAKEIRDYVDLVTEYASKSNSCWCDNC